MQTPSEKSDFGFWSNPILAPALIVLWFAILIFFRLLPEVDLAISNLFFDNKHCEQNPSAFCFPFASSSLLSPIRDILNASPKLIGPALIVISLVGAIGRKTWSGPFMKRLQIVIATLLLGPLLIVNSGFKEFFGRVRPRHIEEFGGTFDFTKVGEIVGQCQGNCSFVSGEASVGGWFLVCGLLFSPKVQKYVYPALLVLGTFMAILRVTFGAHFISDVLLGYLIPIIVCACLVVLAQRLEMRKQLEKS